MLDGLKHLAGCTTAAAIYAGGAVVGALGATLMVIMGAIALIWGSDLVHEILASAAASAIGLTIADYGRKRLHALRAVPKTDEAHCAVPTIKHPA